MSKNSAQSPWILPFESGEAASESTGLALVGGKGANLARLAQAGFPVPGGFLVCTQAYRDFLEANRLEDRILAALPADEADAAALEAASEEIRGLFRAGQMPAGLADALGKAYREMNMPPVAVRSSATAEDLPEMSFAGQQDTYLNVLGEAALLEAVVNCWASLWTARAIGYRARNHVPHSGAALAVVVQEMVESRVSGVLFTANPLTGLRSETVIDATFGLGEALVSGQVEPDHYVVNTEREAIVEKTLGAKEVSIHGEASGGTALQHANRQDTQALADEDILALAQLGARVAQLYGAPQDIEWAQAGGRLYLLQSRPITSLYPTPPGMPAEPLRVFFSFGAVQGMLDPITPLGRSTLKVFFTSGMRLFGIHKTAENQTVLFEAGERLWVQITTLMRNSVGQKILQFALDWVEPTIKQALSGLWEDGRLKPERRGLRPKAILQIARFYFPLMGNFILNMISPDRRRRHIVGSGERILGRMQTRIESIQGTRHQRLAEAAGLLPHLAETEMGPTFRMFVSAVAAGMASFNFVRMLSKGAAQNLGQDAWNDLVLELTRGLPYNPTTEMDLDLWRVAQAVRCDRELMQTFGEQDAHGLVQQYRSGAMPEAGRILVTTFLARYGGRGLAEIDLGRPRWVDDPTHIFEVLLSYLQIEQLEQAPDVVFERGAAAAQAALQRLCAEVRRAPGGWFKAHLMGFFAGRMRSLMGVRESPKFFAVRLLGLLRMPVLQIGAELAAAGELAEADDLFYLSWAEMQAFAAGDQRDWRALIAGRRAAYQRELMRRQVPRLLLSDGRAFYQGMIATGGAEGTLTGSPVSPGSVEGDVRVVFNPREAGLKPGEILVCPGTDPSWTPLFLSAGGLVMEVGGMMTHGAVVAREYGIPAIVGVDQATSRLQTGQKIRINGSTGIIQLL